MNFQNVNRLNVRANKYSGNLLPMTVEKSHVSIFWRIYQLFGIFIEIIYVKGLISGFFLQPIQKVLKNGTFAILVVVEVSGTMLFLHWNSKLIKELIFKLNKMLSIADETMKDIVKSSVKPVVTPFTTYVISGMILINVWTMEPLLPLLYSGNYNNLSYLDYKLPVAYGTESISITFFVLSTIAISLGSTLQYVRKFSLDMYMMNFVLLVTAQYRYIAVKLTILFQNSIVEDNGEKLKKELHVKTDQCAEEKLKALCRHHNAAVHTSRILKDVLSVNYSLLYLTGIFRICFLDIMFLSTVSNVSNLPQFEGICITLFVLGSIIYFFYLCFFIQTLSDASTQMTDNAFHENWYQFRPSIKHIFRHLIMANNNLECKISMTEKSNFSLSSFITVMNQAYSVALLFLKIR